MVAASEERDMTAWERWRARFASRRVSSVIELSFLSGLPAGLLLTAIPTWMAERKLDVKLIGVMTLAQAPLALKFLWAPLFDRFHIPRLGRKRGWILVFQGLLAILLLCCAWMIDAAPWQMIALVAALISFASASIDIVIDGYAVEALRPEEVGLAVGARTASYRLAMWLTGAAAISIAALPLGGGTLGKATTIALFAGCYLALIPRVLGAPEPERVPGPGAGSVMAPFVDFLRRPRALEMAAFLLLYKLADNLAVSLLRPFLVAQGYSPNAIGVWSGTMSIGTTLVGTFLGGLLTPKLGLGRALFLFGCAQALANAGYAVVAAIPPNLPVFYGAIAFDTFCSGVGTGAFSVFLLQATRKQFSATQYALFSSLFVAGRTLAGPIAGALVAAVGWQYFFLLTIASAVPGLWMLRRFVPWGAREVVLQHAVPLPPPAWTGDGRARPRALGIGAAAAVVVVAGAVLLRALEGVRSGAGFHFGQTLSTTLALSDSRAAIEFGTALVIGCATALAVVGYAAARKAE